MKRIQGQTINKDNTLLLVIDPINSCAHQNCETPDREIRFTKIRRMLPSLDRFIGNFKHDFGGRVAFFTITPWTKDNLPENINELYKDPSVCYYTDDQTGFDEKFHSVVPREDDYVFTKNTYDAFSNQDFLRLLKKNNIKYIITTGIFTDGCVLASIISGFSKGYSFVILKDLVETTDDEIRQNIQKLLIEFTFPNMYGKTITSEEFLNSVTSNY